MRNLRINRNEKKAELELNCDFYPEHILRKVVKDFRKIFDADIEKRKGKFAVTLKFKGNKAGIEEASYEFVNYLLAEVKNDIVRV
jgi:5S rRNA maturation endonuclease (ribonuclease M5)